MPDNTPLTGTPYALLGDSPNIETAAKPGFDRLELYVVPRFASISARNLAYAEVTLAEGMTCWCNGEYQTYTGSEWIAMDLYMGTRVRTYHAERTTDYTCTTTETTVLSLDVTTERPNAIYVVELTATSSIIGTNSTNLMRLRADGVLRSGDARHAPALSGDVEVSTISKTWRGTLASAGSHTFDMRQLRAGAGGTHKFLGGPGMDIHATIYEQA